MSLAATDVTVPGNPHTAVEVVVTTRFTTDAAQADRVASQFAHSLSTVLGLVSVDVGVAARPALRVVPTERALTIYVPSRTVRLCGVELMLTRRLFDLLVFLARHPGQVFTRQVLLSSCLEVLFVTLGQPR